MHKSSSTLVSMVALVIVVACGEEPLRVVPPVEPSFHTDNSPSADGINRLSELGGSNDEAGNEPSGERGDDAGGCDYVSADFDVTEDEITCSGAHFVRFDEGYGLFVGVVVCDASDQWGLDDGSDVVRLYLSEQADGPFAPVVDTSGGGENGCELVNPALTAELIHPTMVSRSGRLSSGSVWSRNRFGSPFVQRPAAEWLMLTARLSCGLDVSTCEETRVFHAPDLDTPVADVPCSIDGTSAMQYVIPAREMELGADDHSGRDGACIADVRFFEPAQEDHGVWRYGDSDEPTVTAATINGWSNACANFHCGVVVSGDGTVAPFPCDVIAYCDPTTGLATAVDFTW